MAEQEQDKQDGRERRKHVIYLVGMLFLGLVTYSLAASVGLNLAMKRNAERESGPSATTSSSDAPTAQPAAEPAKND